MAGLGLRGQRESATLGSLVVVWVDGFVVWSESGGGAPFGACEVADKVELIRGAHISNAGADVSGYRSLVIPPGFSHEGVNGGFFAGAVCDPSRARAVGADASGDSGAGGEG